MIMAIRCCKGCVAPKRHTACWSHCPEYIAEKAEHERRKAQYDRERKISNAIYGTRSDKVYKAMRERELARKVKR